jgi:hypothetical protein
VTEALSVRDLLLARGLGAHSVISVDASPRAGYRRSASSFPTMTPIRGRGVSAPRRGRRPLRSGRRSRRCRRVTHRRWRRGIRRPRLKGGRRRARSRCRSHPALVYRPAPASARAVVVDEMLGRTDGAMVVMEREPWADARRGQRSLLLSVIGHRSLALVDALGGRPLARAVPGLAALASALREHDRRQEITVGRPGTCETLGSSE